MRAISQTNNETLGFLIEENEKLYCRHVLGKKHIVKIISENNNFWEDWPKQREIPDSN